MERLKAIKAIVHLETTAEYYRTQGSKRQRDCRAEDHQIRMQQDPPETRQLYQLQSIVRHAIAD